MNPWLALQWLGVGFVALMLLTLVAAFVLAVKNGGKRRG